MFLAIVVFLFIYLLLFFFFIMKLLACLFGGGGRRIGLLTGNFITGGVWGQHCLFVHLFYFMGWSFTWLKLLM